MAAAWVRFSSMSKLFRGWFTNDRVQGFMGLQVVGRRISCSILASGQNAQQQLRTLSGCLGSHPLMSYHHSFSIQSFPRADPTSLDPAHIRSMGALSRKRCSARAPKPEALQAGFLGFSVSPASASLLPQSCAAAASVSLSHGAAGKPAFDVARFLLEVVLSLN